MNLSQVCIRRPVLAIVLSLVVILMGVVCGLRVPNRELPDVDLPIVSVTTIWPGAAPEVIEGSVTQVLEDEIIGIEGVRSVTSLSREQLSQVSVEFQLDHDLDLAANDVRDRVARATRRLPEGVEAPLVAKQDADSDPILWLALAAPDLTQIELSTIVETRLRDRLAQLKGVAQVVIAGERRYAMRIWLNGSLLTAHGLTVGDVATALRRENVDVPSGRLESSDREHTVRTLGELRSVEEFSSLIVASGKAGEPVRIGELGRVEIGPEDERKLVRFNGAPAIALGVVKQSKANTLEVARAVKKEVLALKADLPDGVDVEVAFDFSNFVEQSIRDVVWTIFEAILLVSVVIYLFLKSARPTIVVFLAIPVSLVGTFCVIWGLDFSVNTLTLMAFTLSVGLVVDDAIVVLENITRWIEKGYSAMDAARRGMEEITFAVLVTTGAAMAVFLPLAFLTDVTGRLFREFGVVVAAALAMSGFVALTLSPSLCARILRPERAPGRVGRWLGGGMDAMSSAYRGLLERLLRRCKVTSFAGLAWFVAGFALLAMLPREFVPEADRATFFVATRAAEGSTLQYTARYQHAAEEAARAHPEVDKVFSVVGRGFGVPSVVSEGAIYGSLVSPDARDRTQAAVISAIGKQLHAVPGIQAFISSPPALGRSFTGSPVSLVVQGPDTARVAGYADEIVRRARTLPGLLNLRSDLILNKPQFEVRIDRGRANDLGVSVRDVATTLQILLGGVELSSFKIEGRTYKAIAQLEAAERTRPEDLFALFTRSTDGVLVPLASVVDVREGITPRALPHYDRQRAATITASIGPGATLGEKLDELTAIAKEVLPQDGSYRIAYSGESRDFIESSSSLAFAYILSIVIVYLILAAQFESFLHPVTILIAVALSFTGALVSLWAVGGTINLFSQIGLVMLVGLVTKNSILIVEFANGLRGEGLSADEAALQASVVRFRPILMTAVATIIGILPIALGAGAGGESRAPLGIVVAGGMVFSTAMTIFVVPAAYIVVDRVRVWVQARVSQRRAGPLGVRGS